MKANRKFIEADDRAVSAVIGVILMVAITVAIAATVYVYVSGMIGGTQNKAPDVAFSKQITPTKGLIVVKADTGLLWSDFTVNGVSKPASTTVTAGDFLPFTGGGAAYNVTIVYTPTNTLMGTWVFS